MITKLDDIFGFKLYKSFMLLKQQVLQTLSSKGHELPFEQWIILNRLWDEEGISQSVLGQKTLQAKGNFSRTLKTMENNQLIKKKASSEDGRSTLIFLTKRGRDLKAPLRKAAFNEIEKALAPFHEDEVEQVRKFLDRFISNLETNDVEKTGH